MYSLFLFKRSHFPFAIVVFIATISPYFAQSQSSFRPPAVPLITHDPYFSVWSMGDQLTDEPTRHWTGAVHEMFGMIRIDGEVFRYTAGWPGGKWPENIPAIKQTNLTLWPTRTIYEFEQSGVRLTLTFTTPALPHKLDILSRPVTYISWDVAAIDGEKHEVSLYYDITAEWATHTDEVSVTASRYRIEDIGVLRAGTTDQPILKKAGDRLRIDWGYIYLAVPPQLGGLNAISRTFESRLLFTRGDSIPRIDDMNMPRRLNKGTHRQWIPTLAAQFDLGTIGRNPVHRYVLVAYDDMYSIEFLKRKLRPYWNRAEIGPAAMLRDAVTDYVAVTAACEQFDKELVADLIKMGGEEYANIAVLAYRQTLAAHKLVADVNGRPLYFSKENYSNGSIATVDVAYPSSPFFMLFNPTLLKGMLIPVIEYAQTDRWKFPFAPHDLGRYPLANGQRYGGGEISEENQMPVEECGNILIMTAALAKIEGHAKFAETYWETLTQWAEYLAEKGMDPENQLSTDDFTGHLAHNTNLSLKAIMALGGYAMLCEMLGQTEKTTIYRQAAEGMAKQWVIMADDGDHYKLAFDKTGTWSQKYNLVWDDLLALNLFPKEVAQKEITFYKTQQNEFGLPLDNRSRFTKLDWAVWSATLAENEADFNAFIKPVYRFLHQTPDRVPMTDWYWTHNGKLRGFRARSVVGGVFIKMLKDESIWKKWRERN